MRSRHITIVRGRENKVVNIVDIFLIEIYYCEADDRGPYGTRKVRAS